MTRNELIFSDEWVSETIKCVVRSNRKTSIMRRWLFSAVIEMRNEWVDAAREDEAVAVLDWVRANGYDPVMSGWLDLKSTSGEPVVISTAKLYQLYKQKL